MEKYGGKNDPEEVLTLVSQILRKLRERIQINIANYFEDIFIQIGE